MRRWTRTLPWVAAVVVAAVAPGCDGPIPAPDVVALIGGREVPYAEFESYLRRQAVEVEVDLGSDVLSGLFDQFLEEELLRRLAVDRGVATEADDAWRASRALLDSEAGRPVALEEVAAYYEGHPELFTLPERVRLRQILVEDRDAAVSAAAALAAGKPFEAVAAELSDDPQELAGSDQGELTRDDLPPVFADAIFALGAGEASDVIAADYGYHVFQVTERLPAGVVPLELAAPEIRQILRRERADQLLGELIEQAAGRYNLEVFTRNLPFNYEGFHAS